MRSRNALEALQLEEGMGSITTGSQVFDSMLGAGVSIGAVTEVCGMAGLGKTQLCMQLCASVQIPSERGGVNGVALYIDCEGSFVPSRMLQIADATAQSSFDTEMSGRDILANIDLHRVGDLESLAQIIQSLEGIIAEKPNMKLVVIDSIAFFFRSFSGNFSDRNVKLSLMAQTLRRVAAQYLVAVLIALIKDRCHEPNDY